MRSSQHILLTRKTILICLVLSLLACSRQTKTVDDDAYGGMKTIKSKTTGFFTVDSTAGRWWFITPEGHGYFALGANHTGKFLEDSSQSRPYLERFGSDTAKVREDLLQSYRRLGYNAGEAYAPLDPYLRTKLPYIAHLQYPDGDYLQMDIFDPQVQETLFQSTVAQCLPLRNDKMIIGIAFRDLPVWSRRRMDILRSWPDTGPGKKRYLAFLRERYGDDIQRLNDRDDADFMALIADLWYDTLRRAVRQGAPNHLFLGERHQLRDTPDAVLRVVGKHVDVFLTQALIRSPQRPPEWQVLRPDAYRHEHALTQKPMVIVDWATPFSLGEGFDSERGPIKNEADAARDLSLWLREIAKLPFVIGIFKCQFIGLHANDRWFAGKARRTIVQDDGTDFSYMSSALSQAHRQLLDDVYGRAKTKQ